MSVKMRAQKESMLTLCSARLILRAGMSRVRLLESVENRDLSEEFRLLSNEPVLGGDSPISFRGMERDVEDWGNPLRAGGWPGAPGLYGSATGFPLRKEGEEDRYAPEGRCGFADSDRVAASGDAVVESLRAIAEALRVAGFCAGEADAAEPWNESCSAAASTGRSPKADPSLGDEEDPWAKHPSFASTCAGPGRRPNSRPPLGPRMKLPPVIAVDWANELWR